MLSVWIRGCRVTITRAGSSAYVATSCIALHRMLWLSVALIFAIIEWLNAVRYAPYDTPLNYWCAVRSVFAFAEPERAYLLQLWAGVFLTHWHTTSAVLIFTLYYFSIKIFTLNVFTKSDKIHFWNYLSFRKNSEQYEFYALESRVYMNVYYSRYCWEFYFFQYFYLRRCRLQTVKMKWFRENLLCTYEMTKL